MIKRGSLASGLAGLLHQVLARTPYEVRRRLPAITLEPLDLLLANYRARRKMSTIVQVGACDGTTNDPIFHHVAQGSVRAILIEPNPLAFVRLQKSYAGLQNVTFIQAAVAGEDGEAYLYRVIETGESKSEIDLSLQFSSLYREHLETHGKKPHEIERIVVPCRSLASLVTELGITTIDLLQIDAEGFDAEVVRMALKMRVRPSCINFEHRHLKRADRRTLFDLLNAYGYELDYDDWNMLALQKGSLAEKRAATQSECQAILSSSVRTGSASSAVYSLEPAAHGSGRIKGQLTNSPPAVPGSASPPRRN
jgi:FkbM family methyltransferase